VGPGKAQLPNTFRCFQSEKENIVSKVVVVDDVHASKGSRNVTLASYSASVLDRHIARLHHLGLPKFGGRAIVTSKHTQLAMGY